MRDGFVKVAAVTPKIRVADTKYNADVIVEGIREAAAAGAKVIVLPELVITGYICFCRNIFWSRRSGRSERSRRRRQRWTPFFLSVYRLRTTENFIMWQRCSAAGKCSGLCPKPIFRTTMNFTRQDILPEEWQIRSRSISRESACRWGRGFYLCVRLCQN